jgi:hypothetical protein
MSHKEEPELKLSPAADAAMAEPVKIFSDPNLPTKPRFRCGVEGPDELGLISGLPEEWK